MEVNYNNFKIEEDEETGLYRLIFPDGSKSELYNKTRAIEFLRRIEQGANWRDIKIGYEDII